MFFQKWFFIGLILFAFFSKMRAQKPFTCEGQYYITLTNSNNSTLREVIIDPVSSNVIFRPINLNLGVQINAIGYRKTDNLIYGVNPSDHYLYRVDANGNLETLTQLSLNSAYVYFAGDITPDGSELIIIGATQGTAPGSNGQDRELVRVNLNSPNYSTTRIDITGLTVRMLDIAFDPISGKLFGYDSNDDRLMEIDYLTGTVSSNYAKTPLLDFAGSLFFDAFGNLYAYGSVGDLSQNTLVKIDKERGQVRIEATGPSAQGTDACSCPYTIELTKSVFPEITAGCSYVEYFFTIANTSGITQKNISFYDLLPVGFEFEEIIKNPFGGDLKSFRGDPEVIIDDLIVPFGIDTIIVKVRVGDVAPGVYKNQAQLTNLPNSLGNFRKSENPKTIIEGDSTPIIVIGLGKDDIFKNTYLCKGSYVELDVSFPGASYLWSDGSTGPKLKVDQGGFYEAVVTSGCHPVNVYFEVEESEIEVNFDETIFEAELGDSLFLSPQLRGNSQNVRYQWLVNEEGSYTCRSCPQTWLVPFFNGTFGLEVSNEKGCKDSAFVEVKLDKTRRIFIPNAFSPNQDGINDVFFVKGRGFGKITWMNIFDRWGNLVYSVTNCDINQEFCGWDGTFNGKNMSPGYYVFYTEVQFLDGVKQSFSGGINLIR
jgi:gliding motility-associated-like protein